MLKIYPNVFQKSLKNNELMSLDLQDWEGLVKVLFKYSDFLCVHLDLKWKPKLTPVPTYLFSST